MQPSAFETLQGRFVRPDAEAPVHDQISCACEIRCVSPGLRDLLERETPGSHLVFYPVRLEEPSTGLVLEDYSLMVCTDILSAFDLRTELRKAGALPPEFDLRIFRPRTDRGTLIVRRDLAEVLRNG